MDYEKIYYENEERYKQVNNECIKEFITNFVKKYKIDIESVMCLDDVTVGDYIDLFGALKKYIYTFNPELINDFYISLEFSGFRMVHNIFDDMFNLGLTTKKGINTESLYYTSLAPYINDISYRDNMVHISSNIYGNVSFYSLSDYFSGDFDINKFIRKSKFSGDCHNASLELIKYLSDASLMTLLVPYYYEGYYYHSIIRDNNGYFIDPANYIVYKTKVFDLLNSKVVCVTKKEDLEENLQIAIKASNDIDIQEKFSDSLILALHKQSLN